VVDGYRLTVFKKFGEIYEFPSQSPFGTECPIRRTPSEDATLYLHPLIYSTFIHYRYLGWSEDDEVVQHLTLDLLELTESRMRLP
jgi:hypothetical protein